MARLDEGTVEPIRRGTQYSMKTDAVGHECVSPEVQRMALRSLAGRAKIGALDPIKDLEGKSMAIVTVGAHLA